MKCDQTAEDFFASLNGFDEIAVAKAFGEDITELRKTPLMFLRALVFVHQRRTELAAANAKTRDTEAKDMAMRMTVGELTDSYFPEPEGDEIDPDDPDTDQGKDDSPSD